MVAFARMKAPENTKPPRENLALDAAALERWLGAHGIACTEPPIVTQFKGGQSNPTYFVGVGEDMRLVLRKKPPGDLLPSAHAVEREYRIMKALSSTDVPVPEMIGLCEDASVIGTPFLVMRYLESRIFWNPQLPDVPKEERRAIYLAYIQTLAKLHEVDFRAVGLGDYGKVGGFVARQVDRWSKQYEASRTSDIPEMEKLMAYVRANVPADDQTTLVHGDFRLDNLLFDAKENRVAAVVDWELSTLGHPTSDLAYALMSYHVNIPPRGGLMGADLADLGIPTEQEMIAAYQAATGREVADYKYFMAFGIFRLAAIAQGVYKRSLQGNASSDLASTYGVAVTMLSGLGCGIAGVS